MRWLSKTSPLIDRWRFHARWRPLTRTRLTAASLSKLAQLTRHLRKRLKSTSHFPTARSSHICLKEMSTLDINSNERHSVSASNLSNIRLIAGNRMQRFQPHCTIAPQVQLPYHKYLPGNVQSSNLQSRPDFYACVGLQMPRRKSNMAKYIVKDWSVGSNFEFGWLWVDNLAIFAALRSRANSKKKNFTFCFRSRCCLPGAVYWFLRRNCVTEIRLSERIDPQNRSEQLSLINWLQSV